MPKIKDRLVLGFLSRFLGSIPGRVFNTIEYNLGWADVKYGQMAASLFTKKGRVNTPMGELVGIFANALLSVTFGTLITYTLTFTGRDHAAVKGMGFGSFYWLLLFGFATKATPVKSRNPFSAILGLVDHLVFGATTALIAAKLGDDSIFPEGRKRIEDAVDTHSLGTRDTRGEC